MSVSSIIKTALLGSFLAMPMVARAEVAADPNCWRTDEIEAARFEDFRLKILVGALNCKNYLPGAAGSYNSFLQAKKEFILANMYVVRAHFAREAGASEGADNFANYETLAGNKYSAPTFDRAKCESVDSYARLAAGLSDADLTKFVDTMSSGPLPSGCKPAPRAVVPVVIVAVAAPPPALAPSAVMLAAVPSVPVLVPAVASVPVMNEPMTDAQRVAASTAATRRLLASRAAAQPSAVPAVAVVEAPATVTPAVAMVAPAPVEVAAVATTPVVATAPAPVPAALIVAKPEPSAAAIPATLLVTKPEPAPVAFKADVPAPVKASASPAVALALAEAAKALAVAAAAMAQTGTN